MATAASTDGLSLWRTTVRHFSLVENILAEIESMAYFPNSPILFHSLVLLEPPSQVSLQQNGRVGQLRVSWQAKAPKYFEDNVMFMIRYSSEGLVKTAKVVR